MCNSCIECDVGFLRYSGYRLASSQTGAYTFNSLELSTGYAVLTTLNHLVRPSDTIEVLALQSEHRDGTIPLAESASHFITDSDLDEYRKVSTAK